MNIMTLSYNFKSLYNKLLILNSITINYYLYKYPVTKASKGNTIANNALCNIVY